MIERPAETTRRAVLAGIAAAPVAAIPAAAEPFTGTLSDSRFTGLLPSLLPEPAILARKVVQAADLAIDELFDRYGTFAYATPELAAAEAARGDALDMLTRCRARTLDGLAAKAETLLALPYGDGTHLAALSVSLARDVLAMSRNDQVANLAS